MRKNQSRFSIYENLSMASPKSMQKQKVQRPKKKLPELKGRTPNFLRVGCPTEVLIHIPHYVAVLKKESSNNLAISNLSIKDLIDESSSNKAQEKPKSVQQIWNLFDSIKVPISNFSDLRIPSHCFSLDSKPHSDEESYQIKAMKKINSDRYLKPLSTRAEMIKNEFTITPENKPPVENKFNSPYMKYPKQFLSQVNSIAQIPE
ncbi:hypothetical protein SteCoe_5400 [Stentor coeruleus]|uniref:Uncharacterized protein n=1 Tax=Stentor coeruleus TaxID=5963 RepID=A0A1R2CSK4_9CILI|nr:hypothetical protein SteCoe_5400 [Stentor coeruleus]